MARKRAEQPPNAKCQQSECSEDAVYGFREIIDGNTSNTSGFRVGDRPNWCLKHDAKMRKEYAAVEGKFVGPFIALPRSV